MLRFIRTNVTAENIIGILLMLRVAEILLFLNLYI